MWEFTSLIRVHHVMGVIHFDVDICILWEEVVSDGVTGTVWDAILVERTPWRLLRMWPCCVSLDCVKSCAHWIQSPMDRHCSSLVEWLQSYCFGRETRCGMEIPDGLFNAGEFIEVEDGVMVLFPGCPQVVLDSFCGWYDVFCVKQFSATWRVKDKGVFIVIAVDLT